MRPEPVSARCNFFTSERFGLSRVSSRFAQEQSRGACSYPCARAARWREQVVRSWRADRRDGRLPSSSASGHVSQRLLHASTQPITRSRSSPAPTLAARAIVFPVIVFSRARRRPCRCRPATPFNVCVATAITRIVVQARDVAAISGSCPPPTADSSVGAPAAGEKTTCTSLTSEW
jgi:hypothetical protein